MVKNKKVLLAVVAILIAGLLLTLYITKFRTCTITFALKIGAGIQAQEVKVGKKAVEPKTPTAEGYEFEGWYLDGEIYDFDNPVKKDIVLEAKWKEK